MNPILWIIGIYIAIGVATAAFAAFVGCKVAEKDDPTLRSILSFGWVYWFLVFLWPSLWIRILLSTINAVKTALDKKNSSNDDLTPKE